MTLIHKSALFVGWRLHFNNIFLLWNCRGRISILSSWSQCQSHKHILVCRVLVGNYTTGQQGMKVPLWKMTKSDLIQWQIPSTHPHNSSHSMTLIHKSALFRDGVYTSTTFSYSAQELFSPVDHNGHKHYSWFDQGLSWELYNRTAGNESTPMRNVRKSDCEFSDRFHRHTHTIHHIPWRSYTKVHCSLGWRLHFNNIFLLCPRTILSSWSQWSQTYPGLQVRRVLVGNYTTGQQGMKVPLWKITISDTIQWQIPSTHPHNSLHSMTLKHILSIASLSLHDRPTSWRILSVI